MSNLELFREVNMQKPIFRSKFGFLHFIDQKDKFMEYELYLINLFQLIIHCVKGVRIRSYSGQYFLAFGLNTDGYFVSFRIQSEFGKIQTRITPNADTFYAVIDSDTDKLVTEYFMMNKTETKCNRKN